MISRSVAFTILVAILCYSCSTPEKKASPLMQKSARFAPTEITADLSALSPGDRTALEKLIAAAKLMDSIYLRQVWSGNVETLHKLEADNSPEGAEALKYFRINMSPWSNLDHDTPFVAGVPSVRPEGADYYPSNMTKEEFTTWLATLDDAGKKDATGFFHVIRRDSQQVLTAIPYSTMYKDLLEPAARLLREASEATSNATLRSFLEKRAAAFLSNDYYASDVAWMDLDSPIEPTIGPYEVYMDRLFNYKAAFEAFIALRNEAETQKLAKYSSMLQDVENNLPIDPKYRNPKLGALAPIRVVDLIVTGGESRAGVQTAAFNLPNDEKVTAEKGSKRVMLKNVQEAKFNKVLVPISRVAITAEDQPLIAFEPFFTHILAHELMHGLGPQNISVNGRATTVRASMKELHSALEEAKADISGLFLLQYLVDKGELDKTFEKQMYATYLAGAFRSIRFGINEAHGKGMALQFNYLLEKGAFTFDSGTKTFGVDIAKMKDAAKELTGLIMTIQAEGRYDSAKSLFDTYVTIPASMQAILDSMKDIPVDIAPRYTLAHE